MKIRRSSKAESFRRKSHKKKETAVEILNKNAKELISKCHVNQLGIGYKVKDDKMKDDIGILVFVTEKLSDSILQSKRIKPIPKEINGIVTDVIEIPDGINSRDDDNAYEPFEGGTSLSIKGNQSIKGTLGIIVKVKNKITSLNQIPPNVRIPSWVKNTAKWWSEGKISDNEFVAGIQHLIQAGIILVPSNYNSNPSASSIPTWIKTNAKWWSEGKISDNEFANAIQYLMRTGIIKIPVSTVRLDDDDLVAITNNHIGAKEFLGDKLPTVLVDEDWVHPARTQNHLGDLKIWSRVMHKPPQINRVDAAIAKIPKDDFHKSYPYTITQIGKVKGIEESEIGDNVLKRGRKTGRTTGIIFGMILEPQTISVNFQGEACSFSDQLIIVGEPSSNKFSDKGDSGSLIVSAETDPEGFHKAKGLLFAGASTSTTDYTFANKIENLIQEFPMLDFEPQI